MLKQAEHFLPQHFFLDAIMVVQACLGSPAKVHGGSHIGLCPLTDLFKFFPIIHLLIPDFFHRGAGYDKTVKLLLPDLGKGVVKFI